MLLKKLVDWFTNPLVIIVLVIFFLIVFIVYLQTSHELTGKFWQFGPVLDDNGSYYKYMTFNLDTWSKVITVYTIIFLTSFVSTLYNSFFGQKISYIENMSKITTYLILGIHPFIKIISYIVNFFAVACFQIQYLLPLFVGSYLAELPFIAKSLIAISEKKNIVKLKFLFSQFFFMLVSNNFGFWEIEDFVFAT